MERSRALAALASAEPSAAQLQSLATEFLGLPEAARRGAEALDVYAAVLQARLVLVFAHDAAARRALAALFGTVVGLGCLASRLSACAPAEVGPLVRLIEEILLGGEGGVVPRLLAADERGATSLFFGSRLLAAVAAQPGEQSWVGDAAAYARWLARQMVACRSTDARLLEKGCKLGAPAAYLEPYRRELPLLAQLYGALRPAQERFVLTHALMPQLPALPGRAARLLAALGADALLFLDVCVRRPGTTAQIRAAVLLARHTRRLGAAIDRVAADWASEATIATQPLALQQAMTQFLIAAAPALDAPAAARLAHSPTLSRGVSNHLASTSAAVRNLGTLVAEVFAKQAGAKLEFGIAYADHEWWLGVDTLADDARWGESDEESGEEAGERQQRAGPAKTLPAHLRSVLHRPAAEAAATGDSDDEDDPERAGRAAAFGSDEDDEDPEEAAPLFYVKDLLAYLRSEKYAEVNCALTTGAALITRKASFGDEVSHYGEEVIRAACSLTDKYNITDFPRLRQSLLNAVVLADPARAAPIVVQLFAAGDWSLAQRQVLLAALVHAAHSLSEGGAPRDHERLPGALHNLFVSPRDTHFRPVSRQPAPGAAAALQSGVDARRGISDSKEGIITQLDGRGSGGSSGSGEPVTTYRSRRLDLTAGDQPAGKNLFSEVASRFFFPLLAAEPPLRHSSYDAVIYAQWLRTLGVLVVESHPSRHMPAMVAELWPLLRSLVLAMDRREVIIQEAIYSCLVMIISVSAETIATAFAGDVGGMLDAVAASVAREPTPQAQAAGRAAQGALATVAGLVEARLLGSR